MSRRRRAGERSEPAHGRSHGADSDPDRTRSLPGVFDVDSADEESALPERIGSYPILGEAGRGGMGRVFIAEDPKLKRRIALKALPSAVSRNRSALARLEREARLLASINHANIATVYSLETAGGTSFLTMELVPGETLAESLEREPPAVDRALSICLQIAKALEAAHKSDVIHRDLKPPNVMLTPDGLVKILDFGLAKALAGQDARERAPRVVGTPGYMSPEQIRDRPVDVRTDVWSFGCVAYECFSGHRAFPGDDHPARMAATLEVDPDWDVLSAGVSDQLRVLLARCLVKDPEHRLDSIVVARREIEEEVARRMFARARAAGRDRRSDPVHDLPQQLTSFVGRERELGDVVDALSAHRLVTLTGVGGGGKTRLAVEVAHRMVESFPDGAAVVPLASSTAPDLVAGAVAKALAVETDPGQRVIEAIVESIAGRAMLLVMDNCEHVAAGVAEVTDALLRRCTRVRILATSREPLGLDGECIYRLPMLALPRSNGATSLDELAGVDAVRLFVERAGAARRDFRLTTENAPWISQICRRLDGLPLALELAAARTTALDVTDVAARLDDRFRLLGEERKVVIPQHRTLRTLIDWSYDHLDAREQVLFCRLAVLVGGWTLRTAEAVCAGDGIDEWDVVDLHSHLVDKSLVEFEPGTRTRGGFVRYRMLETVREYARERLQERGEDADRRRRHACHFAEIATEASAALKGQDEAAWLDRLTADAENLRAALDWAVTEDPSVGVTLLGPLARFWFLEGQWREIRERCEAMLTAAENTQPTLDLATTENLAGNLAFWQGDLDRAEALHTRALETRRAMDHRRGIAGSLNNLGNVAERRGDYARAQTFYEESLAINRELGEDGAASTALHNLGFVAENRQDYAAARALVQESLEIRRGTGDRTAVGMSLNSLGNVAHWSGDPEGARRFHRESLEVLEEVGDRYGVSLALVGLARVALGLGEIDEAARLLGRSTRIRHELRDRTGLVESLEVIVALCGARGDAARGARLLGAAAALRERLATPPSPNERGAMDAEESKLRERLGESAFAREVAEGHRLTLADAVATALAATESDPGGAETGPDPA